MLKLFIQLVSLLLFSIIQCYFRSSNFKQRKLFRYLNITIFYYVLLTAKVHKYLYFRKEYVFIRKKATARSNYLLGNYVLRFIFAECIFSLARDVQGKLI